MTIIGIICNNAMVPMGQRETLHLLELCESICFQDATYDDPSYWRHLAKIEKNIQNNTCYFECLVEIAESIECGMIPGEYI